MKCPMNSDQSKDTIPNSGTRDMNDEVDFSEFVWMGEENLEEFDRNVELELWEEQFIESCFNEMWRTEDQDTVYFAGNDTASRLANNLSAPRIENGDGMPSTYNNYPTNPRQAQNHLYQRQPVPLGQGEGSELSSMMESLSVQERNGINQARSSKLNPDAEIFVPRSMDNMTVTSTATNVDR